MNYNNPENEIKYILENLHSPEMLDDHPWAKSIVVQTGVTNDATLQQKSPGQQLGLTLVKLFRQLMPSTMPKRGKRLDTNWGHFGILAAKYFTPFVYGTVYPKTLRDAGGRIDQAISYFVFNKPNYELSEKDVERYKIIGDEDELIPISTLSDWHTKGLQKLAKAFIYYEQHLNNEVVISPVNNSDHWIGQPVLPKAPDGLFLGIKKRSSYILKRYHRNVGLLISLFVIVALLVVGIKIERIYHAAGTVLEDIRQLKSLTQPTEDNTELISKFNQAGKLISKTKIDLNTLHSEVKPYLWLSSAFFWVPKYGGDLAQAKLLFSTADGLINAADETIQGTSPIIDLLDLQEAVIDTSQITAQLNEAQPHFVTARASLDIALVAYSNIDVQKLSPNSRDMLIKIEPLIKLFDDGLKIVIALPKLMGATDEGPQTYIVLLQNEDELRATGGFLTGVATIVLENGKILSFKVEDSYAIDNPDQYYPPAPWQLERYMAASHWVLRDSNWSPDFPTTAKWVEMFIATARNYSVDGVIAVDQESLRYILKAIGPMTVENVSYPITADNVINYMRTTKSAVPRYEKILHRKDFMADLAQAILQRMQKGGDIPWVKLGNLVKQAVDERHILLQIDDPTISSILAQQNWDGAVRTNSRDFLLVVDSNVGFTKVNTVMNEELSYEVDFSHLDTPTSILTVIHKNNAKGQPACNVRQLFDGFIGGYEEYINLCYLDYLRIYKLNDVELIEATPHSVPAEMVPWNVTIPAKVDNLLDEKLTNIRGYGTLLYVPGGESLETRFSFQLPPSVLDKINNLVTYSLHIQKQSGTIAVPVTIIIHLPAEAEFIDSSLVGILEGNDWSLIADLRKDIELSFTFKKP